MNVIQFLLYLTVTNGQSDKCRTGWKTLVTNEIVRCVKAIEHTDNPLDTARSRSWSDAEADCQKYEDSVGGKGHLMSIHTSDEALALQSLFINENWDYWIGLRMNCPTCDFSWSDHSPFDYANWQEGEPNNVDGLENCVEMNGYGDLEWNDHKCDQKRSYICSYYLEGDPIPPLTPPSTGGCPSGSDWVLYGGVCYKFKIAQGFTGEKYRQLTFAKAEEECQSAVMGGHLAMMKTPWHNAFVTAMAGSDVFVGITSETDLGKHFIWIDGTPLTYTQWRKLHPTHHDLLNDAERIGTLLHPYYSPGSDEALLAALSTIYPGDWDDVVTGATNLGYSVCSVEASPESTNQGISYPNPYKLDCPLTYKPYWSACYRVVTQQYGFDQANEYCKSEGKIVYPAYHPYY